MDFNKPMGRREAITRIGKIGLVIAGTPLLTSGLASAQVQNRFQNAVLLLKKYAESLGKESEGKVVKGLIVNGSQDFQWMSHGWSMEKEDAWYKGEIEKRRITFALVRTDKKGIYDLLSEETNKNGEKVLKTERVCYSKEHNALYFGETIPTEPKAGGIGYIKNDANVYFVKNSDAGGAGMKANRAILAEHISKTEGKKLLPEDQGTEENKAEYTEMVGDKGTLLALPVRLLFSEKKQ